MPKSSSTTYLNYFGKKGLGGGLNVSDNPLLVAPEEMTIADNVLVGTTLARRKRYGQEQYDTSDPTKVGTVNWPASNVPIRRIIQYNTFIAATGEPVEYLFLHSADKVWSIANRTSGAVNQTGALVLSTTGIPSYQVFEGKLYFLSTATADGYNVWDGTVASPTAAVAATDPADGPGKYLGVYQGRMIMAGNVDFPFRLYISAPLDAEDWASVSATSLDFDFDGDPSGITAIFPQLEGRLYVATRRNIYELTGTTPATFVVRRVTKGIGCISHNSVVATPNDILFASDRGIHSLRKVMVSDQTEVEFLSKDIQRLWTNLLASNLLEQTDAVWDENLNLYLITVPSSGQTTNDTILAYNLSFGTWANWSGCRARSIDQVLINNKAFVLIGREDGNVSFLTPTRQTDLGVGFTMRFKTGKIFPGDDIMGQKLFKSVGILASSTKLAQVQINWFVDSVDLTNSSGKAVTFGTESDLLGSTFIMGLSTLGFGRFLPKRLSVDQVGFNFQLEIVCAGDSDIEFYGFVLEAEEGDPVYV